MESIDFGAAFRNPQRMELHQTEDALFDASQYAFFGKEHVKEVELGGLEDEDSSLPAPGLEEEDFLHRREAEVLRSLSDIDDLNSTFAKLNKTVVSGAGNAGVIGDRRTRSSTAVDDLPSLFEQRFLDDHGIQDEKRWSSQPYSSSRFMESNPLYRTSSYPEQQQYSSSPFMESNPLYRTSSYPEQRRQQQQQCPLQHYASEPIIVPESSYTSYPPPGGQSLQFLPNYGRMDYLSGESLMESESANIHPFSNSQPQLTSLHHGSAHFGGTMPKSASGLFMNRRAQNQWLNQSDLYAGDHQNRLKNVLQQQLSHQNMLMAQQMVPQVQSQLHRLHHPVHSSLGHSAGMQSQLFSPHISPSSLLMKKIEMFGLADLRDQRQKTPKVRHSLHHSQHGSDTNIQHTSGGLSRFKSKYMTADEIESILKMQFATTHNNDPYADDYYHQASLAKKSAEAKLKHRFCPKNVKELPAQSRMNTEAHSSLQAGALARVPFPSIRRPRPLYEINTPVISVNVSSEQKVSEKPLEQEPMMAARITIEDGMYVLLDVDDIDRFLEFNQLQDGGNQLRHRRQILLEGLAAALQLVDPFGKNGHTVGLSPKDDIVFLRLVSLPKGRKLLARYLQLLFPGGDLMRVVCMAIFRHLRFLFGAVPADIESVEATNNLARVVSLCARCMDLGSLGACLAAVVCSSEQPPLRSLGRSSGSGASLILLSVIERATKLLKDLHTATDYNRALWKASFDEFFALLIKYCINKYDSVMQSSLSDGVEAIKVELPLELLRASVPLTNDLQKKLLFDLSQRSLAAQDNGCSGQVNSDMVPNSYEVA